MPRIMNRLGWSISGAVALGLLAALAGVIYAGPLDPPKPPAPTQETWIYQPAGACPAGFPIVLGAGGSYKLAGEIAGCAGTDGIQISANNVSLDLNGFTVRGVAGALTGITLPVPQRSLTLVNGVVKDWPGGGVNFGSATGSRLAQLQVTGNGPVGGAGGAQIRLGDSSTLSDCIVTDGTGAGGASGIKVTGSKSVVDGCLVSGNQIAGLLVTGSDNRITNNHVLGNQTAGVSCQDIDIDGLHTIVEDNTATKAGAFDSCPFAIQGATAAGSIIKRNTAQGGAPNYFNLCGGLCDVGPIGTAALATSPWANISD